MEGALQGIPSIALSQYFGPDNAKTDDPFEAARLHGAKVVRQVLQAGLDDGDDDYRLFYNINFPPVPASDVKGVKATRQGMRYGTRFGVVPHMSPAGRRYVWIHGGDQRAATAPDTDAAANLDGYISVTPMRADLTDHTLLDKLSDALT